LNRHYTILLHHLHLKDQNTKYPLGIQYVPIRYMNIVICTSNITQRNHYDAYNTIWIVPIPMTVYVTGNRKHFTFVRIQ